MTVKDILDRIAKADTYLKKHKDPKTGEGLWQMEFEHRGRMVHELHRLTEHGTPKEKKDAAAVLKKVSR